MHTDHNNNADHAQQSLRHSIQLALVLAQRVRKVESLASAMHNVLERVIVMTEEGPQPACVIATNVYHRTAQGWRMVAHHASPGTLQDAEEIASGPQVLH